MGVHSAYKLRLKPCILNKFHFDVGYKVHVCICHWHNFLMPWLCCLFTTIRKLTYFVAFEISNFEIKTYFLNLTLFEEDLFVITWMRICIFFENRICNIFLNIFPKAQCIIKLCYGYSTPMMNANEILLMGSDLLPLFSTLFLCRGWDITFDVCMCEVNQCFLIFMTC